MLRLATGVRSLPSGRIRMGKKAAKSGLRLGATPTAGADISNLEQKDARAGKKVRALLNDLKNLEPTAPHKRVKELMNSRNPMHKKLAKELLALGFSESLMVATDDLTGPSAATPTSTAFVIYSDEVATPNIDRGIIGAGLLVRGERLLPLDESPHG
jgi:hypothetical protein